MPDAFITAAVRTPMGRAGGVLAQVRPDDLAAAVIRALVNRAALPTDQIDDVILGCANQAGEDNRNVGRMAALLAGLPVSIPGQTVNRLCGSGLQAVVAATHAIRAGEGNVFVAGGVESMTRAPQVMLKSGRAWDRSPPVIADSTLGWRFVNPSMPRDWTISLGETAERVGEMYGIGREEQDAFALESQRRALAAIAAGVFDQELIEVEVPGQAGSTSVCRDESPRPGLTLDMLRQLEPAFTSGGSVTAGSSSGINDGAAALSLVSKPALDDLSLEPMARVLSSAVAGVDPSCMGLGPIPATRKALERAGVSLDQIDVVELNEAFAVQAIACIRELGLDPQRVNIYGGAIALGHPLGASGARILTTLVHALRRTGGRYGLATMCIGVGQGIAVVLESTA